MALGAEMLVLAGLAPGLPGAAKLVEQTIASGSAAERFSAMIAALGGPRDFLENADRHLARASVVRAVDPTSPGIVQAIATRAIGLAVVALGGGRTRPEGTIDHAVGFTDLAGIGTRVDRERPLAVVHARTDEQAEAAARTLREAYTISDAVPAQTPLVLDRIGAGA